jgi:hypothetical protein
MGTIASRRRLVDGPLGVDFGIFGLVKVFANDQFAA